MIYIIYFLVIVFANVLGAISGFGGGTLIKPVFDGLGFHSLTEISFFSTVAVFVMSISSTLKQMKNKVELDWTIALLISLGSVIGGLLGNHLFDLSRDLIGSDPLVNLIQILIAIITLLVSYLYTLKPWKSLHLKTYVSYVALGLILGLVASYLGIGGGPLNMFLLMWVLAMPVKEAAVYSIIVIFFSQLAKILMIVANASYQSFDLVPLLVIVPAAILGGYLGAKASGNLSEEKVTLVFRFMIILTVFINVYNAVNILLSA